MSKKEIAEHDIVVLTRDIPEQRLLAGDTAVVIDIGCGSGGVPDEYLLEVFAGGGATLGVISVPADAVRPPHNDEVHAVRPVAAE